MKSTLSFDLNDPEDQLSHRQAIKAQAMAIALWEIFNNMPRAIERKVESEEITDPQDVIDEFRGSIYDILQEQGIDIDSLFV